MNYGRFIYFMRIFEDFAWLIRIVEYSFWKIRYVIILVLGCGFIYADVLLSIDKKISLDQQRSLHTVDLIEAYDNYWHMIENSFLFSMGDFGAIDVDNYDYVDFFVFMGFVMLNIIVIMNLLIAIVGEAYNYVKDNRSLMKYSEKTI